MVSEPRAKARTKQSRQPRCRYASGPRPCAASGRGRRPSAVRSVRIEKKKHTQKNQRNKEIRFSQDVAFCDGQKTTVLGRTTNNCYDECHFIARECDAFKSERTKGKKKGNELNDRIKRLKEKNQRWCKTAS